MDPIRASRLRIFSVTCLRRQSCLRVCVCFPHAFFSSPSIHAPCPSPVPDVRFPRREPGMLEGSLPLVMSQVPPPAPLFTHFRLQKVFGTHLKLWFLYWSLGRINDLPLQPRQFDVEVKFEVKKGIPPPLEAGFYPFVLSPLKEEDCSLLPNPSCRCLFSESQISWIDTCRCRHSVLRN